MNTAAPAEFTLAGMAALNELPRPDAEAALLRCCSSIRWARAVASMRPFATATALVEVGRDVWRALPPDDWRQAFASHPRIGAGLTSAGHAAGWSAQEQSAAAAAGSDVRAELAALNAEYEARFGHIFIVCATGLGAEQMLSRLRTRMRNAPAAEFAIAAAEQERITELRLHKLLLELGASR